MYERLVRRNGSRVRMAEYVVWRHDVRGILTKFRTGEQGRAADGGFLYVWRRYAKPSARYAVALMMSGDISTKEEAGFKRGRHLSGWTDMRS